MYVLKMFIFLKNSIFQRNIYKITYYLHFPVAYEKQTSSSER